MTPLFLPHQPGPLFALYFPPATGTINRAILHVPAFAEEMNKSRRMVALQARAFAERGFAVLVLDLFGTGDSAGDFGDAKWEIWLQNIDTAIAWLRDQGAQTITLWGFRLGTLLAMDFASRNPHKVERLLSWQPVLNGDTFITQLLRLRIAAAMLDSSAPKEKTSDLKRQLLEGQSIEVAGYNLNPDLVRPLVALRAEQFSMQTLKELAFFEVVANEETQLSMSNTQFVAKLREKSVVAALTKVAGDAFWATQEITVAPDLISLTTQIAAQWR